MEFDFDLENPLFPTSEVDNFPSLFHIETCHMPSKHYLQSLNAADSNLCIRRREIVSVILSLSRKFDPFSSYLAVNYVDRFLSAHMISVMQDEKPWISKIVAVSCFSLALKMRQIDFSLSGFQHDGGLILDSYTVERMEMLMLGALNWRMRSINPFSFVNFFISLFEIKSQSSIRTLKDRAREIIFTAQTDIKLLEFKSSVISASALLAAAHRLFPSQFSCFRNAISSCEYVNMETLINCYSLMQEAATDGYAYDHSVAAADSSSCTPANVLDLQCFSSSSSETNITSEISVSVSPTGEDRSLKRRKLGNFLA